MRELPRPRPRADSTGRFPLVFESLEPEQLMGVCRWLARCCHRREQMDTTLARIEVVGATIRGCPAPDLPLLLAAARMHLAAGDRALAEQTAQLASDLDATDPATLDLMAEIRDVCPDVDEHTPTASPPLAADDLTTDEDVPTRRRIEDLLSRRASGRSDAPSLELPTSVTLGQMVTSPVNVQLPAEDELARLAARATQDHDAIRTVRRRRLAAVCLLASCAIGFVLTML